MRELGNVLIVDDDNTVAEALRQGLTRQGYRVDVAMNPGDALMLATLSRPDAIIMDVGAGDANDTRLFAKLQAIDDSLVVILLAGSHDEAQVRGWLKAGAFDWARKPVSLEVLEPMVRRAVSVGQKHPRRGVVVPFSPERRRGALHAVGAEQPTERGCPVCRLAVETADINAVLESGDIFHASCWLNGRAQAQQGS